jgi:hypothetical protein
MSAVEERLYALMEVVTQQQESVQRALDGLAAERAALERERQALARNVEAMRQGAQSAVRLAVRDSLAEATATIAGQAETALAPTLGKLSGVLTTAQQAEGVLKQLIDWASWRLLSQIVAGIAVLGSFTWVAGMLILRWDAGAIGQAQEDKVRLQADVAELKANYDDWEKTGALDKIIRCSPGNRPCVRVDESAGRFGDNGDIRILNGY